MRSTHLNAMTDSFRLLQGIEANIGADGQLDLSPDEARSLRARTCRTALTASAQRRPDSSDSLPPLQNPAVRILAHPRGRITGSRAGVVADWDRVFTAAADSGVAVEIDGDPARQDLDYALASSALAAGCLFALDSDAHTTEQLSYAETAIAHARLAGVPADRIVNYWPLDRLVDWLSDPHREVRTFVQRQERAW